jgi:hypothetical protein
LLKEHFELGDPPKTLLLSLYGGVGTGKHYPFKPFEREYFKMVLIFV